MIDTGLKIAMSVNAITSANETSPVAASDWRQLKDCTAMPALIQPSAKIVTDFIGDEYTGEILGKRAITGLDFTFAFDTSKTGGQYRFLTDIDDNNERHWLRVEYPDGTKFQLLVESEVTLVAPTPSGEIDYTLSVTPCRNKVGELIIVTPVDGVDPLATSRTVTKSLTHCTIDNGATSIADGSIYEAMITPESGYTLDGATASVTMGGADVTTLAYNNGRIYISSVTDNLSITVTAVSQ